MKIIVYHREYGCETGCCGHVVEVDGRDKKFNFSHPFKESVKEFIENLVAGVCGAEAVKDIDFDHCVVLED